LVERVRLERVIVLKQEDLQWPFHGEPYFETKPRYSKYARQIKIDSAFPCYIHDPLMVQGLAKQVEDLFPVEVFPNWYLISHEAEGRTNGYATKETLWNWDKENDTHKAKGFEPYIVLSGKRIPLHPAMTRYLVAHEYGHIAQYQLEAWQGIEESYSFEKFEAPYAELRGIEPQKGYGGGRWHTNTGEVIANDFRILVAGCEAEFWPHPGVAHPYDVPQIQKFWEKATQEAKEKTAEANDQADGQ
jgi:hypothetical protein